MAARIRPALACLLLLVAACSTQAALDNVITQWQVLVQDTVRAYTINNQIAALYHGLVGVAQYEAVTVALADGADEVAAAGMRPSLQQLVYLHGCLPVDTAVSPDRQPLLCNASQAMGTSIITI